MKQLQEGLKKIIADNGADILNDPRITRAYLGDYTGNYYWEEIQLLSRLLENNVHKEIVETKKYDPRAQAKYVQQTAQKFMPQDTKGESVIELLFTVFYDCDFITRKGTAINPPSLYPAPPPVKAEDFLINNNGVLLRYKGRGGDVVIPKCVRVIGEKAFYDCSRLTGITIPASVTSIERAVFSGCSGLTDITIPSSVTSIGKGVFYDCSKLTGVTVDKYNQHYKSMDGVLFSKDGTLLHTLPIGKKLASYTIPASVTSIGAGAFFGCENLTSVTIPASVTSIEEHAFSWCESLTRVTIPSSVTSIKEGAFRDCKRLTGITISESVTSIERAVFSGCSRLIGLTIPASVTSIGAGAFSGCKSLTRVTIPASVTSIGIWAFRDCKRLTSVTISESVTSIGAGAFFGCENLTSVTIPESVTSIGKSAFSGCYSLTGVTVDKNNQHYKSMDGVLFSKDGSLLHTLPMGKKIASYIIPASVTSIGDYAFWNCRNLTRITIPASVTSIGNWAFPEWAKITYSDQPKGLFQRFFE